MSDPERPTSALRTALRSLGPAIIVASIVLGPGSILISSKIGCQFGYQMIWVLFLSAVLMIGMTSLAAYLGAIYPSTLCEEISKRFGRPAAASVGILMFVVIACFQASNNTAIIAITEGLQPSLPNDASSTSLSIKIGLLLVLNGVIITAMLGLRNLYRHLEKIMMAMVLAMLVGFGVNLFFARPSLSQTAAGLIPTLPQSPSGSTTTVFALLGLVATTFSVAGAFYQSYLVREKGWNTASVKRGLWDSIIGIAVLGIISAIIMMTSAAALHGRIQPDELRSVADVAKQLEPLFGSAAYVLFGAGLFAAALSSFLGNALIGGTILSDGLGLGASINQFWPKALTILALVIGMTIGSYSAVAGNNAINFIFLAQALTVLGTPLLASLLLGFGIAAKRNKQAIPIWVLAVSSVGLLVSLVLAAKVAMTLVAPSP